MTTFSGHSFEQYYQSIRRLWRFGQKRDVTVDHVLSDGEQRVLANLRKKADQADRMFRELSRHIQDELKIARHTVRTQREEIPSWL